MSKNLVINNLQKTYSHSILTTELDKGKQSGDEKGWLSFEYVKQYIKERYQKH